MAFLKEDGLARLWQHINLKLSTKVNEAKDYTDLNTQEITDEQIDEICGELSGELSLDESTLPQVLQDFLLVIYPIGSIYIAYNHINPSTLFGGVWERMQDCFLWATDASGTIGQTGGEKTHTLTVNEMPNHIHRIFISNGDELAYSFTPSASRANVDSYANTTDIGGNAPHNNMPPYIQVSMWRRVS